MRPLIPATADREPTVAVARDIDVDEAPHGSPFVAHLTDERGFEARAGHLERIAEHDFAL